MRFTVGQDTAISTLESELVLMRGEEVEVAWEVVLSPYHAAGELLFDHGHSKWVFQIAVEKAGNSRHRVWKTYRSPHDLWRFLRGSTGQAWELHQKQHVPREPKLLLNDLLYCSDGLRSTYLLQLIDEQESLRSVRVLDKHCGFRLSLYADAQTLYWRCFKGAPGSVTPIGENGPTELGCGFVFECSLEELLSLPAYEPDPSSYTRWRRVLVL